MKAKFLQYRSFEQSDDLVLACLRRLDSIELVNEIVEATFVVCNIMV